MKRNEYSEITTLVQLRTARKALSDRISGYEEQFTAKVNGLRTALSLKFIAIKFIRKLRETISGTPFAKS